ncbi:MAG: DUF4437 domain-containing protein [Pseudomonadota bacterium]|nr:DUF4437 domain-containing protein [Pseudomonadota bacterium]
MKKALAALFALSFGLSGVALAGDVAPTAAPVAEAPVAGAAAAAPAAAPVETRWAAASLAWVQPFGPTGPEMSYVKGDPKAGPFQMFLRMPAGGVAGWHTHDAAYSAVVVQGTWQHLVQGEGAATNLPAGSFWVQDGTANHDDRCIEGPCVVFIDSVGAQTYHPKTAEGNDPPPPVVEAPVKEKKSKKKK